MNFFYGFFVYREIEVWRGKKWLWLYVGGRFRIMYRFIILFCCKFIFVFRGELRRVGFGGFR